mmetsp:Transcript_44064/g.104270  ORF Transcript_44064/g.104270 Transcript_44064/m.104270 type:complete len:261 (+) Transcript_44064:114-896(+)
MQWRIPRLAVFCLLGAASVTALSVQSATSEGTSHRSSNPLVDLYRRKAKQYERDALLAEEAAHQYAQMTQAAAARASNDASTEMQKEFTRVGADTWTRATYNVERMLEDDSASRAADAAKKAEAPYKQALAQYIARQSEFSNAAATFATHANADASLSHQLMTHSNQHRLEGQIELAEEYAAQSKSVMKQAEMYGNIAKKYDSDAWKIHRLLPRIQSGAEAAAKFAAWQMNPRNALPPEEVYPFTIAPPVQPANVPLAGS